MDTDKTPVIPDPSSGDAPVETPEEIKARSAEGRINELLAKNKELERKMGDLEAKVNTPPTPTPPPEVPTEVTPQVQQAIDLLKKTGKFVDQQQLSQEVKSIQDRIVLDNEHARLEGKFTGEDGRPTYERREVEEFMRKRGIYDPEVAYKTLHEDELLDWTIKKAELDRKKKPYIAKPGGEITPKEEGTITREKVAEALTTAEGRVWYEQNRDKILGLMAKGQL